MKSETRAVSWGNVFYHQYPECHQVKGQALQCQSLAGDLQVCPTLGGYHLAVLCTYLQSWRHVLGNSEWGRAWMQFPDAEN